MMLCPTKGLYPSDAGVENSFAYLHFTEDISKELKQRHEKKDKGGWGDQRNRRWVENIESVVQLECFRSARLGVDAVECMCMPGGCVAVECVLDAVGAVRRGGCSETADGWHASWFLFAC